MLQPLFSQVRDLFTPAGPPEPLFGRSKRPFVRRLPYLVALLFVAILLPTTTVNLQGNAYNLNGGFAFALALAQTGPLLLAVRRPLAAWAIAFTADIMGALALLAVEPRPITVPPHLAVPPHLTAAAEQPIWPWSPMAIVGMLVLMVALGLRERRTTLVAVWLVTSLASAALVGTHPHRSNGSWVAMVVIAGVLLVLCVALRERGDARRALAEQETISEAERAQRTLLEERTRIARELHDVVAHHMSVITVQADSAPYRIAGLPPEASEEFGSIAATARESLSEMRRLLGVLRSEDTGGDRAPQPGVDRIGQLVEATVRSGQPVELVIAPEATAGPLPQAVDLSAYRIVQEALANVVRHAPGAITRVSVTADRTSLMVLVVNAPADRPDTPLEASGTGHGLVGMRERVRLVGGTLDTGPLPDGGFRVAARLPFTEETTEEETPAA